MALVSLGQAVAIPQAPITGNADNPATLNVLTLNASGDKAAGVYKAPVGFLGRTVHKFHYRTGTVTTGDTLDIRFETVDATNGNPSGTLWATNTNAASVVLSTDDNVWKSVTLTADADIEPGNDFAVAIVNGAGGGNLQIGMSLDPSPNASIANPYGSDGSTGTYANLRRVLLGYFELDNGAFVSIPGLDFYGPITGTTYNNASATDRRGNILTVPLPMEVTGAWVMGDLDGDCVIEIYDADGTSVIGTTPTLDKDIRASTVGGTSFFPLTAAVTLTAGVAYRIAIRPTTATNITTYEFDVPTAAAMDTFMLGQNYYKSIKTSGTWAQTTTSRTLIGIMAEKFSDGIGSPMVHIIGR